MDEEGVGVGIGVGICGSRKDVVEVETERLESVSLLVESGTEAGGGGVASS